MVFFELLTGRRLFRRDSDIETFESVRQCKVPRPSEVNPAIPGAARADPAAARWPAASTTATPRRPSMAEALREFVFTHQLRYRGDQLGAWMRQVFRKN